MALFGPGFVRAGPALALLLLMPALATLSSSQNMALLALNRPLTVTYITVARMVTILTLSTLLSLTMGMTGVALGVVCRCAGHLALQLRLTQRGLTAPLPSPLAGAGGRPDYSSRTEQASSWRVLLAQCSVTSLAWPSRAPGRRNRLHRCVRRGRRRRAA